MKATALGALVIGTGWIAVLLGFLAGSLAPALVGVALVAGAEAARWQVRATAVQVRRVMPERVELGQRFEITVEASSERSVPLWVEDGVDVPLRSHAMDAIAGRGMARCVLDVEATEAGTASWRHVDVRIADPWGLWHTQRRIPLHGALQVAPESDWVAAGRRTGRRHTVETMRKGRKSHESVPEVETIREFRPGDRLRDVDWARTSRMRGIHTKQRERVNPRPVLVLLDATASMRYHRRRSKITTAARLAYGLVAAADAAGVASHVVAYDERGVVPVRGGRRIREALQRLSTLDAPVPVAEIPLLASGGMSSREERGFLGALSSLAPGQAAAAPPLETALGVLTHGQQDDALVVVIQDGEADPDGTLATVQRLRRAGHDAVVVVPATGAHHYRRHEAAGREALLRRFLENRAMLHGRLRALKVPMLVMAPDEVDVVLEEVAAWAA